MKKKPLTLSSGSAFPLVLCAWVVTCLVGALPYYCSGAIPRFCDAVFESVSGFTTTGATIIADLDSLPPLLHLWRALTHWLGGMGIIVLTVALVPFLGAGAFQLLKAETSGPDKGKWTPKITQTAKILWLIYLVLTVLQTLLLMAGGMSVFDALIHAFSTIATGGFSNRNESIAYYHSPYIEWVCIVFMLIAGFNFTLIYRFLQGKFREVTASSEARAYAGLVLVSAFTITVSLLLSGNNIPAAQALRQAFFHTASILTTTGFMVAGHNFWPPLAQCVLFLLMFVGGCSGSTAGGVKVIRHVVLYKQMRNEMKRLIYPQGVFSIQLDQHPGRKEVVHSVISFVFLYLLLLLAAALLVSSSGVSVFNSLNAALITLGAIGLGLGDAISGHIFQTAPDYVKWGLSFIMLTGRLELFTIFAAGLRPVLLRSAY
jgi:trk system potassium uptake protein TrkH